VLILQDGAGKLSGKAWKMNVVLHLIMLVWNLLKQSIPFTRQLVLLIKVGQQCQ